MLPPNITYLLTRLNALRQRLKADHSKDNGSITLEWMVIAALLFLAAIWAATKIVGAIHSHANGIH